MKIRTAVAVAALAATVACGQATEPPDTAPRTDGNQAVLSIDSKYQGPVTVYVQRGPRGPLQRVGTITFGREASYRLGKELLASSGGLRLQARAVGSSASVTTETLHVEPGDTVRWTLLDPLDQSITSVRVELGRAH